MMQRLNQLRRQYHKLTVYERTQLALAAKERGDLLEIYALDDSCPAADAHKYLTRMMALEHSATLLVIQLLAFNVLVMAKLVSLAQEQKAGATPAFDDELLPLLVQQAPVWHGFAAVCQDLGHDPRQVLRMAPLGKDERAPAFYVIHHLIEQLELLAEVEHGALLDPDQVRTWRRLFTRAFIF
jgi:hypothetical protein